jgi:4-hydroxy-4-methyl-2-oxoglutarate aldolase
MPATREVLERLVRHSTPTVCNAIEEFKVRPRNQGFMAPKIRCMFPELGPMVGHAVTVTSLAGQPGRGPSRQEYWDYVLSVPAPRVVVVQDLDPEPIGAMWGEVQANIHRALGCLGTVTDGGVRDLDEVAALGFHFFAATVLPSHAFVHVVDFGCPVTVAGLEVRSGDIIHADKHGVTSVPESVAPDIDEAVAAVADREARIIAVCQAQPFDLARLKALF